MIGFFEYQYLKFKKNHLRNLVALAKADGHVDETEVKFLHEIGQKYGLKERQVQEILESTDEHEIKIPKKFYMKVGQLYDIVGMMMADEVIDEKEMEFCHMMCERMSIKPKVIDEMVKIYKRGGVQDFEEWEDFVEESKKFEVV